MRKLFILMLCSLMLNSCIMANNVFNLGGKVEMQSAKDIESMTSKKDERSYDEKENTSRSDPDAIESPCDFVPL